MSILRLIRAANHLRGWLIEHNIDPDAVSLQVVPREDTVRDPYISARLMAALSSTLNERKSLLSHSDPRKKLFGSDWIELAGIRIEIK